jgi:hypothetical protein
MDGGGCGLGVTLTGPPPPFLFVAAAWAGWANQATRAVNRPAGPQAEGSGPQAAQSPSSEVRRTLPDFQKVQKNPLNLHLALRFLSFIYSDLLVMYIYVLDLELFCNFYVVTDNIICTIWYIYLCNLNLIITTVIIHVYDPQIISRY